MRVLIAAAVLISSFFAAYIRYSELKKDVIYHRFFLELTKALIHNNASEMQPFYLVFEEKYSEYIEKISISSTAQAFDVLPESNLKELLRKYLNCGEGEIYTAQTELLTACENALTDAQRRLKERGKSALALYPSAAAILLIILI